jgi:hypothetical protein
MREYDIHEVYIQRYVENDRKIPCLGKDAVREENGCEESPDVDEHHQPSRNHLHPNRGHSIINGDTASGGTRQVE